ncbi:hypothetical protein [Paenibacillus glycinis]|uniref:Uncharacterized protein n=1 Tax=Paenibacillus glycinis TaxID=2697035 RepID=A0ABW9XXR4_9BACL|nr:hypothetical protein [Paenibacillus glycinis]NBD27400.1 hypothetical protein [Paenibacillus glycinis]
MRLKACLLILLLLVIGCSSGTQATAPGGKPRPAQMKLTPIDLFEGDAAKFKLFLGPMTGAFQLAYEGDKPNVSLDIDIWKNGRKVSAAGAMGDLFYYPGEQKGSHEVELVISIDAVTIEGKNRFSTIKVGIVGQAGSSLSTFTIPWDEKLTARGLLQDAEPRSFTADRPVHVFGMQATSSNGIQTADFSPESLGQTEWALVFTLRFE